MLLPTSRLSIRLFFCCVVLLEKRPFLYVPPQQMLPVTNKDKSISCSRISTQRNCILKALSIWSKYFIYALIVYDKF